MLEYTERKNVELNVIGVFFFKYHNMFTQRFSALQDFSLWAIKSWLALLLWREYVPVCQYYYSS